MGEKLDIGASGEKDKESALIASVTVTVSQTTNYDNQKNIEYSNYQPYVLNQVLPTRNDTDTTEPKKFNSFSKKQWATLIVFAFVNIWSASCISIQAPFFPKEAEDKGASNTESGFVFGCFQFTVLVASPIFGKYMYKIGPKLVFNVGITVTGICSILFGLLTFVQDRTAFVALALIIRIIEAGGYSAAITATFTLIAAGFPDSVATVFALMETFNGAGLIIGPMIGVWLYHIGGFLTPFAVIGILLLVGAGLAYFVMPETSKSKLNPEEDKNPSFFKLILIPSVAMAALSIFAAAVSIGFNFPTLEPHIRDLELGRFMHGLAFVTHGLVYALTAPLWGRLCDKFMNPKYVSLIGAVLIFIGIALIGPVSFLPCEKSIEIILIGLCIQGLGLGAVLVSGFTQALRGALEFGCVQGIPTFGLVSGLWMAAFSLGNFVGPSAAGYLYDEFDGYSKASIFVLSVQLIVIIVFTADLLVGNSCWIRKSEEKSSVSVLGEVNEGYKKEEQDLVVIPL